MSPPRACRPLLPLDAQQPLLDPGIRDPENRDCCGVGGNPCADQSLASRVARRGSIRISSAMSAWNSRFTMQSCSVWPRLPYRNSQR